MFKYFFQKKLFYVFLFIAISILPIFGCASEGILAVGILIVMLFWMLFDLFCKKLFCRIIVETDGLVFNQGGVFWKRISGNKKFLWKKFNFTIYYFYKNKKYFSDLYITDNDSRNCFHLKGRNISNFTGLVEALKNYNQNQ